MAEKNRIRYITYILRGLNGIWQADFSPFENMEDWKKGKSGTIGGGHGRG